MPRKPKATRPKAKMAGAIMMALAPVGNWLLIHAAMPIRMVMVMPIPVDVESLGEDRCAFEPGSDHPEMLALYLGLLDADFTTVDAPELAGALRRLAGRYQRAIGFSQPPD